MNTSSSQHKSTEINFIELPIDILRTLALRAEYLGVSVKRLIEHLVINSVDSVPADDDDEAFYAYLLADSANS